jgi:hypothetical protein
LEEIGFWIIWERIQGLARSNLVLSRAHAGSDETGVYLGIDVAIKEVLPSKDYDVAKYFEREWRLMKYVALHLYFVDLKP